jgi:hypothetical protein
VADCLGIAARLLAALRPAARILLLIMLFLVLSEATFADYAASPFTETALYGMLVFAITGVAVAARARGYHAAYLVAWASAILAVGAKTETATLALPLALFLGSRRFPSRAAGDGQPAGSFLPCACSRWP